MIPNIEKPIPTQSTLQQSPDFDDCEELYDSGSEEQIGSNQSQEKEIKQKEDFWKNETQFEQGETDFIGPSKQSDDDNLAEPIVLREPQHANEHSQGLQSQVQHHENEIQRPEEQEDEKKQKQNKEHVRKSNNQRHFQYQRERRDFKVVEMKFASRILYSAFHLLRDEFKKKISPKLGHVQLNPYQSNSVKLLYYDDSKKEQLMDKVEEMMENIQQLPLLKNDAESGAQMSWKFMMALRKLNVTIYRDATQNFITSSYYICGNVPSPKILHQKISEIRKMKFFRIHLSKYENTRSFRAIIRKIYETPQTKQFIKESFKALEIQVCRIYDGYQNIKKRGVMTLLTLTGEKNIPFPFQIDDKLTNFMKETYSVFCFTFTYRRENFTRKFLPKTKNVCWFFIAEKNSIFNYTYLFIIINNASLEQTKKVIIKEIEGMNIQIFGRRFFRNLHPIKHENVDENRRYRTISFPRVNPYSWTIRCKKGEFFDWKAQLQK